MLYSGTDPESYITKNTLVYEDNPKKRILHLEIDVDGSRLSGGERAWGIRGVAGGCLDGVDLCTPIQ